MYQAEEIKSYTKEEICNFKMIHKMIWESRNICWKGKLYNEIGFWLKYRILCDRKSDEFISSSNVINQVFYLGKNVNERK